MPINPEQQLTLPQKTGLKYKSQQCDFVNSKRATQDKMSMVIKTHDI